LFLFCVSHPYEQGACVLRQLWSYLGNESFFSGVRIYLARHRDECVCPAQLWQSMRDATNDAIDVEAIMKCWITTAGHPYITVTKKKKNFMLFDIN
jgi:aminopeptidase N